MPGLHASDREGPGQMALVDETARQSDSASSERLGQAPERIADIVIEARKRNFVGVRKRRNLDMGGVGRHVRRP